MCDYCACWCYVYVYVCVCVCARVRVLCMCSPEGGGGVPTCALVNAEVYHLITGWFTLHLYTRVLLCSLVLSVN